MPRKAKPQSESDPQSQPQTMTLAELRASLLAEVEKQLQPLKKAISELEASKAVKNVPTHSHDVGDHSHRGYVRLEELDNLTEMVKGHERDIDHLEKIEGEALLGMRPGFKRQRAAPSE